MINTELPIPLHIQISTILDKKIRTGVYEGKIPSERELVEIFSVSRTTVRQAINKLAADGILKKIPGKGTFINKKKPIHKSLSNLNSLTETVEEMGMKPGSRLLCEKVIEKSEHNIEVFDAAVYKIERLRYADGIPIAIEKQFYPLDIGIRLTDYDLHNETIFDLLENEIGINLFEAEQFISTEDADERISDLLTIPKGSNVLTVERIITDQYGFPVEFYFGLYRPDMYVFRVKSRRNSY
ncbi:GntR family transcriptional regulator [Bacillus freudenreichii]|nr:GntR family transcriptional regulator [Bacillus freudenreichii]